MRATPSLNFGRVAPEVGNGSTHFGYRVVYNDADNQQPTTAQVHIFSDNGTTEIAGSPFAMSVDSQAEPQRLRDGDYRNGEQYILTYQLTTEGMNYHYQFEFKNGDGTGLTGALAGPIVDTSPVTISAWSPSMRWMNSTSVTCRATIADNDEVAAASVQYRISTNGTGAFGAWESLGLDPAQNAQQLICEFTEQFALGTENWFQFRATDRATNTVTTSPEINFYIDTEGPSFTAPTPAPDDWLRDHTVECGITITDAGGSGVNPTLVRYRWKNTEMDEFTGWSVPDLNEENGTYTAVTPPLGFSESAFSNYIEWRAADHAGTTIDSDRYLVRIDTQLPSIVAIDPADGAWVNTTTPNCTVTIDDSAGSGIGDGGVEYSVQRSGEGDWSSWSAASSVDGTHWYVRPLFSTGASNRLRWRAIDRAGNGYTTSPTAEYTVDLHPPSFHDPSPAPTSWVHTETTTCGIRIVDHIGPGRIDPESIQIRYSKTNTIHVAAWFPITTFFGSTQWVNGSDRELVASVTLGLENGTANLVQWRARDAAGNWNQSLVYRVRVNTTIVTHAPVLRATNTTPPEVLNDGAHDAVFTVEIHDADGDGDVVSVTLDARAVGGDADLALADDGLLPDATADDGVWTAGLTIGTEVHAGPKLLPVTVRDVQGHLVSGTIAVEVVEYTNYPRFKTLTVNPTAVHNIGDDPIVLAIEVEDGDGADDIVSVAVDATVLGGGEQLMLYDDGVDEHGDRIANDSVYSVRITPATTYSGNVSLPVQAVDQRGLHANGSITLAVLDAPRATLIDPSPTADPVATSRTIRLRWSVADDDTPPTGLRCDVYLSMNETAVDALDDGALIAARTPATELNVTVDYDATTYYWQVIPYDEHGRGRCTSGTARFSVQTAQSYMTELLLRAPGASADTDPALEAITIAPGTSAELVGRVKNKGDGTDLVTLSVRVLTETGAPATAIAAVTITPTALEIERGQSGTVTIVVAVDESAPTGVYRITFEARSRDRQAVPEGTATVTVTVGDETSTPTDGAAVGGWVAAVVVGIAIGILALLVLLRRRSRSRLQIEQLSGGAAPGDQPRSPAAVSADDAASEAIPTEEIDIYYEPEVKKHTGSQPLRSAEPRRIAHGPYHEYIETEVVEAADLEYIPPERPYRSAGREQYDQYDQYDQYERPRAPSRAVQDITGTETERGVGGDGSKGSESGEGRESGEVVDRSAAGRSTMAAHPSEQSGHPERQERQERGGAEPDVADPATDTE